MKMLVIQREDLCTHKDILIQNDECIVKAHECVNYIILRSHFFHAIRATIEITTMNERTIIS